MAGRILIAEQDDALREALVARMKSSGHDVFQAPDTETAAEIVNRERIDVAVIGLAGFENEGLDLLRLSRSIQSPPEIILLVGKHQGNLAIKGMKLGAFRDAQLPIHVESLQKIVQEAFEAGKGQRKKSRIVGALSKIFAAGAFAEHGEYDTAKEIAGHEVKKTDNK